MESRETVRVRVARFRERLRDVVKGELGMRAAHYLASLLEDGNAKTRDRILAAQALLKAGMSIVVREPAGGGCELNEFWDLVRAWKDGRARGDPDLPQPPDTLHSFLYKPALPDGGERCARHEHAPPENNPPALETQ